MYNELRGNVRNLPDKIPHVYQLRTASSPKWVLIVALVCTIGFVSARFVSELKTRTMLDTVPRSIPFRREAPSHQPEGPLAINLPAADAEDLLRHLDSAIAGQKAAVATLRHSQRWINRVLPSLDDDSLAATRLQLASSSSRASEAQISRSREELEIARRILIERSKLP